MVQQKWRKLVGYYKPYLGLFLSDMFFAILGAGVTLVIPLIVRYITGNVIFRPAGEVAPAVARLALLMLALVLLECFCNFYIGYYGHIMGASIERDMRNEIFSHYQKLSFTFFDNQKVGQLLSRITSDLFDISELLHHGPEDILISLMKFVGSFAILLGIHPVLALVMFAFVPFMLAYAFVLNRRMKRAFKENRARIADINSQIEDSLSGIRVVKSFANEDVEMEKFGKGNQRFVDSKRVSYRYMDNGKAHTLELSELRKEKAREVCDDLIQYLNKKYNDLLDFEYVLVTGGTGACFYDRLLEYYKDTGIMDETRMVLTSGMLNGTKYPIEFAIAIGAYKGLKNMVNN